MKAPRKYVSGVAEHMFNTHAHTHTHTIRSKYLLLLFTDFSSNDRVHVTPFVPFSFSKPEIMLNLIDLAYSMHSGTLTRLKMSKLCCSFVLAIGKHNIARRT